MGCENDEQATRACGALDIASVIELANGWDSRGGAIDALKENGLPFDEANALFDKAEATCFVQVRKAAKFGLSKPEMQVQRPQHQGIPCSSGSAWPLPDLIVPYESSDLEKAKVKKAVLIFEKQFPALPSNFMRLHPKEWMAFWDQHSTRE